MKQFLIVVFSAAAFSGCQNKTINVAHHDASANNSPMPSPVNASGIKTGQGVGVVTKINLEIGSVELNHEEIKNMMPAMQMEFYVADKKDLETLKVNDKVAFTLEDNRGAGKITKITKVQ